MRKKLAIVFTKLFVFSKWNIYNACLTRNYNQNENYIFKKNGEIRSPTYTEVKEGGEAREGKVTVGSLPPACSLCICSCSTLNSLASTSRGRLVALPTSPSSAALALDSLLVLLLSSLLASVSWPWNTVSLEEAAAA